MSIINKIEDLLNEIESLLKNQNLELKENTEINDLIKTKRELIEKIQKEFLESEEGIKRAISHLNLRQNRDVLNFLEYLQMQLSYLKNLIEEELVLDKSEDIEREIEVLHFELKTILKIKDNKYFKNLVGLYVRVSQNQEEVLGEHKNLVSREEIEVIYSNNNFSEEYENKLRRAFSTNKGIFLLNLLGENCQGYHQEYEVILKYGFGGGILKNSKIQQLEVNELLEVIKIFGMEFINLRRNCQIFQDYKNILKFGFYNFVLENLKIRQLEVNELLGAIKIFGEEFINLRRNCQSVKDYENILRDKFNFKISNIPKVRQLEVNELLEAIKIFEKIFLNFRNIEIKNIKSMYFLIEKIIIDLNDKNYEEKIKLIINFFNKQVRNSKDKRKIIEKLENFNQNKIISYILLYYMKYRPKSLIDFIENINVINDLKLEINIRFLEKSIKPLTEMNKRELEVNFSTRKNEKTNLENFYLEICSKLNYKSEKELKQLNNYIIQVRYKIQKEEFDNILYEKYLKPLTDIFANLILNYFDNLVKDETIKKYNLNKEEKLKLVPKDFLSIFDKLQIKKDTIKIEEFLEYSDSQKFLESLGCKENITKIIPQVNYFFQKDKFEFNYDTILKKFIEICNFYSKDVFSEINERNHISKEEKINLIKKINKIQKNKLNKTSIWDKIFEYTGRDLVIYFREEDTYGGQMDRFEFMIIVYTLYLYIRNNHSKIFTKLKIISRSSERYPKEIHKFFKGIEYLDVKGKKFKERCSIYANSIHLTNGSVVENDYFSIPILGTAIRLDGNKMRNVSDFISLHLFYFKNNHEMGNINYEIYNEKEYSGDIKGVIKEVLRAVIELEDKMIEQCKLIELEN